MINQFVATATFTAGATKKLRRDRPSDIVVNVSKRGLNRYEVLLSGFMKTAD